VNRNPADELSEDLASNRMYGEGSWNPLEQEPIASHRLDRMGRMVPLPSQEPTEPTSSPAAHSSFRLAMRAFWITTCGAVIGAWMGWSQWGLLGAAIGAYLGGWGLGRLFKNL
jgi:hypothetical protein